MEYNRFEQHIRRVLPVAVLRPFAPLLAAIPETLRREFLVQVQQYRDITAAFDWVAFSMKIKNQPILDYAHQRMQDNMSEIMD